MTFELQNLYQNAGVLIMNLMPYLFTNNSYIIISLFFTIHLYNYQNKIYKPGCNTFFNIFFNNNAKMRKLLASKLTSFGAFLNRYPAPSLKL